MMTIKFLPVLALAALGMMPCAHAQDATTLGFVGEIKLPSGLKLGGVEFGGISDLDYDKSSGLYYAVSDDRAQNGPARFYKLKLDFDAKGVKSLDIVAMSELRDTANATFAEKGVDPEGISLNPVSGLMAWSSERDGAGKPFVYEADIDGHMRRAFAVPAYYTTSADGKTGVYDNLAFEGLSYTPDGSVLFAAIENGLAQDSGKATLEAGSLSRFLAFDPKTAEPSAEYVYKTEAITVPATAEPKYNDNGVSAILALDATHLIVVERTFASGYGNEIRLYDVSLDGATNVLGKQTITGVEYTPLTKTLIATLREGDFGLDIDNIESIVFGPDLDGNKTLVLASDNNFNLEQFTQFVVFTYAH